jgi:hypothetical protein
MGFRDHKSADLRIIARIINLSHGVQNPNEKTLEKCSKVFMSAEGSWERFFKGDPKHVKLLKDSVKAVIKSERKKND